MSRTFGCGHERTPENTTTKNRCRACNRAYQRQWRADRKAGITRPRQPKTLAQRIERRTQPGADGCLIWTGSRDSDGYPKIIITDDGKRGQRPVHRIYWELLNGPIPDGQELARHADCPNRRCIEPLHLTLNDYKGKAGRIAQNQNISPTHYRCGHDKTPENSYVHKDGYAECKTCSKAKSRERCRRWRERHPDKVLAYNRTRQNGLAA